MKKKKSIILPSVIPVRFPADEELAAAMRALPVMRLAQALARWVGDEPIPIADGWQAPETKLDAARALGLVAEDGALTDEITRRVNWIYEIAFHAGYLHTEHGAVHRHHGLDTATEQTDAQIRTAWDGALNALFAHGVEDLLPEAANPAPLDFHGIGNFPLLAMLEQHGTATVAELSGEIALGATEGMTPSAAEHAWAAWTSKHDDPTRGYLGLAEGLGVLRIDGETATLTPLGTWAMLRQLHNAHLEHLPDSAELTPYQVLVCRLGMSDEAFARELECWLTAREPGSAVTELLTEAAAQDDSPRYLRTGVQIAAGISGDTHETWREALAMPEVRPYAAAELNRRAGRDFWDNPLPGLEPIHCDSAVMASHGIIAAYEGSKDPAEVARAVREEASRTSEAAMFEEMWRSRHQVAYQALAVIGQHHPDKKTAKAARAALHKASSARLPTAPHGPLQPSARSGRAPPAREKRSPGPRGAWPASRQLSAAAARPRTSGQPAPSHPVYLHNKFVVLLAEEGAVPHKLVMTRQVRDWLHALRSGDPVTRRLVAEAIDRLLDNGPALGRSLADRIAGSRLHNLKELRPGSSGTTEVRILFIFDPARNAVLLVAGNKSGRWDQWYRDAIPAAEAAYEAYLKGRAQR